MELLTYDLVRAEDLDVGSGTTEVRLQDQSVIHMHRINLSSLLEPVSVTLRATDSTDGGKTLRAVGVRPQGCRTWWVTCEVRETFGTSQGLTHLALGDAVVFDGWGGDIPRSAGTVSAQGYYGGRGDLPVISTSDEDVIVTACGGLFDSTGVVQICVHLSWVDYPDAPHPWTAGASAAGGWPPATQEMAGVVELATIPEHLDGLRGDVACTPEGLQAKWHTLPPGGVPASEIQVGVTRYATDLESADPLRRDLAVHPAGLDALLDPLRSTDATHDSQIAALTATVPPGTPLRVVRYGASGTTLEASPATVDAAGALTLTTSGTAQPLVVTSEHTATTGGLVTEAYQPGTGAPNLLSRKARGTRAAPLRVQAVGEGTLTLQGEAWARDAADTADGWRPLVSLRGQVDSLDAQGRVGGYLAVHTAPGVSAPLAEALRVTGAGNVLVGLTTHGTGLTKGLVVGSGTPPSTSPADAAQLYVADRAGVAGQAALYVRGESNTTHVLGDVVGIATQCTATLGSGTDYQPLNVRGTQLFAIASTVQERATGAIVPGWTVNTDATRQGRLILQTYDATASREGLRVSTNGTAPTIAFLGGLAPVARQTVPVAAVDPATTMALVNSLRSALVAFGLCA